MDSKDPTPSGKSQVQFPSWLQEIVTVERATAYINRRGFKGEVDDILAVACQRLNNAKNENKVFNRGYVFKTLRNLAIDAYRKQERDRKRKERLSIQGSATATGAGSVSKNIENEIEIEVVYAVTKQLDSRERLILRLKLFSGYTFTFKEIGYIIGYSASTARQEYKKILKKIKTHVKSIAIKDTEKINYEK